jgi:hypothetical protein
MRTVSDKRLSMRAYWLAVVLGSPVLATFAPACESSEEPTNAGDSNPDDPPVRDGGRSDADAGSGDASPPRVRFDGSASDPWRVADAGLGADANENGDASGSRDANGNGDTGPSDGLGANCLAGAGATGVCVQSLAVSHERPNALAVNGDAAYWITSTSVVTLRLLGGGPQTIVRGLTYGADLKIDANYVYYLDNTSLSKLPLAAGGFPTQLLRNQVTMNHLAMDATSLYFTRTGPGTVLEIGKNGAGFGAIAGGDYKLGAPSGIVVEAGHVYFAEGNSGGAYNIRQCDLYGNNLTTLASGQFNAAYLASDNTSLYWFDVTAPANLMKLSFTNPQPQLLGSVSVPSGLLSDGTTLYYAQADSTPGQILRRSTSGGIETTLARSPGTPQTLAIDETAIYWFDMSLENQTPIYRLMKASPR